MEIQLCSVCNINFNFLPSSFRSRNYANAKSPYDLNGIFPQKENKENERRLLAKMTGQMLNLRNVHVLAIVSSIVLGH